MAFKTYRDLKDQYSKDEYIYFELIPRAVKYWMAIKGTYASWQDIDDICSEIYLYYKRDKYLPKLDLETEEPRFLYSLVAFIVPLYFRNVVYRHNKRVDLFEMDNTAIKHAEDPFRDMDHVRNQEFRKVLLDDDEMEIFELYFVYRYKFSDVARMLGLKYYQLREKIEAIKEKLKYILDVVEIKESES